MLLPGNESSCWADLLRSNRSVPGGPEPGGPEPGGPEPEAVGGPGPEAVVVPAVFGLIFVRHLGAGGGGGRRVLSPTNVFVLNLSVADLSFLLCCVPLHATVYSLPEWLFGSFLCIFTLVAMSVDRYVAVVRSNKSACVRSRRNALSGLAPSGLCPCCVRSRWPSTRSSPATPPPPTAPSAGRTGPERLDAPTGDGATAGFLLPLLLISCCYFRVLFHLHKKMKNMSKKSERSKRKTAQTVLLVVTAFAVCWMPHHIIVMWVEFGSFPLTDASFAFRIVSHCLSYGNSCVNPVLYAFLSENFRKACCQVFTCYLSSQPPPPSGKVVRFHLDTFSSTHSTTNI
uniref:G-protein coupled receptors family 1 profile domain-containing protein n=1 Tax=Amphiprion percula TaxID=161767 RepID=A0A3P8RIY4_AMPPE